MPATRPSSLSRFLELLKSSTEPGMKVNTIKKIAPGLPTDIVAHEEPTLKPRTDDGKFPREYYAPRPVPKTFVVGEVHKVSNCGGPSVSIEMRQKVADDSVATQPEETVVSNPTVRKNGQSLNSTSSCQPRSYHELASTSTTLKSSGNIDTLPYRVKGKRHQPPTFDLLLGQQDPTSSYFTRRLFSEPFVGDESSAAEPHNEILHHISELDPQAFHIFKIYTHNGKLAFNSPAEIKLEHFWISCWPLMNAHILGCIIEEYAFADMVMDTMAQRLALASAPDPQTVEHLFDLNRKSIPEVLKAFVVNGLICAQQRSCDVLEMTSYPAHFNELALQSALQHLSYSRDTTTSKGCEYHTHGDKEACYKSRLTTPDILKEQKMLAARENSARDAELVTVNTLQHGVRLIDWAQRRTNARPALQIETSQTRPNLRGLANGKLVEQVESTQENSYQTNGSNFGKQDTEQSLDPQGLFGLTNGTRPKCELTKTPHNSPVLQIKSTEVNDNATLPASHTSGNVQISAHAFEEIRPPQAFLLAELEDNSAAPRLMEPALEYKPRINRMRASKHQIMPALPGTNGAGEAPSKSHDLGNSALPSTSSEEVTSKHEMYVR